VLKKRGNGREKDGIMGKKVWCGENEYRANRNGQRRAIGAGGTYLPEVEATIGF
jgi:hypothetical protein